MAMLGQAIHHTGNTMREAARRARRGTLTTAGFIPHLIHPEFGFLMPICVQIIDQSHPDAKRCGGGNYNVAKPRIVGDKSFWALPGGGIFVSHEPVTIL